MTNTGGRSANAVIIAREYKIPLVAGTKSEGEGATLILKTGQKVVVDGYEGAVYECLETKSAKSSSSRRKTPVIPKILD